MINIKNIDDKPHNMKDSDGVMHSIRPQSIITIPRNLIDAEHILMQIETGFFIVFPNNTSSGVQKKDDDLNDRFGLMDLEQ